MSVEAMAEALRQAAQLLLDNPPQSPIDGANLEVFREDALQEFRVMVTVRLSVDALPITMEVVKP